MTNQQKRVIGGVDTHKHTHHAAVIDDTGQLLGDREFRTDSRGEADLLNWLQSHGEVTAVGVEGTGFYGASLARHITRADVRVVEVNCPQGPHRRLRDEARRRGNPRRPPAGVTGTRRSLADADIGEQSIGVSDSRRPDRFQGTHTARSAGVTLTAPTV